MSKLGGVLVALSAASLAANGCGAKEAEPPVHAQAPAADPEAAAGRAETPEELAEKMRHCPVTLPGVTAELRDVDGGIRFALRAETPAALAEVRARGHRLADRTAGRAVGEHGGGRGGGFLRHCPVVVKDTRVIAEDTPEGVRITVAPTDPTKVAALRATSRERMKAAPIERARVVREETSDEGEVRLFSGGAADLDGDGTPELVAGGFSTQGGGHRSTIRVYRQRGDAWAPVAEAGWDDGPASTVRNVEIADIDGDGRLDVVALGRVGDTTEAASARVAVFGLERDRLVLRAECTWRAAKYTHGYGLALGDLDGDGAPEIATGGFEHDGDRETGFVRVWSLRADKLVSRARLTLDGAGAPSMRINDLAIGDVDGDHRAELVVAGRRGPLKSAASKDLAKRREQGDLAVLGFGAAAATAAGAAGTAGTAGTAAAPKEALTIRARHAWSRGTSLRLRTVVVSDLDGDGRAEIVAGGQYDADGKPALALFRVEAGKLVLGHDASATADGSPGEIKDLVVARRGATARVLTTGVAGEAPGRQGDVAAWRLDRGKLVRDAGIVSRNADETRARAVVLVPTSGDAASASSTVLTIGHARNRNAMIGQVLEWNLAGS